MNIIPSTIRRSPRGAAFTLIELLVVIAIIMVLLAVLAPSLRNAREQARRAVCASNVHQISAMCLVYAHDYRGKMPPGNATIAAGYGIDSTYSGPSYVNGVYGGWPMGTAILVTTGYMPRTRNVLGAFYCPSWTHPFFQLNTKQTMVAPNPQAGQEYGGWSELNTPLPKSHIGISYAYRSTFNPPNYLPENLSSSTYVNTRTNQPMPSNPVATAILADHWYTWLADNIQYGYVYGHSVGYNAGYADGHVSWLADPLFKLVFPITNMSQPNGVYPAPNGEGSAYPNGWTIQEDRWQEFFDNH